VIIRPIGERVLLKHQKKEEVTKGGIYIPESARQEKKEGIVIAVGTFEDGKELPLKKGDHVIYGGYQSDELKLTVKSIFLLTLRTSWQQSLKNDVE